MTLRLSMMMSTKVRKRSFVSRRFLSKKTKKTKKKIPGRRRNELLASVSECYPFLRDHDTVAHVRRSKVMFVMRGLPGSGKSTVVRSLRSRFRDLVACSADRAFCQEDGTYEHDVARLAQAHSECRSAAETAALDGRKHIVVDNTNVCRWEMTPYFAIAERCNHAVVIVSPKTPWRTDPAQLAARNAHGCTVEYLEARRKRFQAVHPNYWGWFLNETDSADLLHEGERCFNLCVEKLPEFRHYMNESEGHVAPFSFYDYYRKHEDLANQRGPSFHCTSFFGRSKKEEKGTSHADYASRKEVEESAGKSFKLKLTAVVITPRTVGMTVKLCGLQRKLWGREDVWYPPIVKDSAEDDSTGKSAAVSAKNPTENCSVKHSTENCVKHSTENSVKHSTEESVKHSTKNSVKHSTKIGIESPVSSTEAESRGGRRKSEAPRKQKPPRSDVLKKTPKSVHAKDDPICSDDESCNFEEMFARDSDSGDAESKIITKETTSQSDDRATPSSSCAKNAKEEYLSESGDASDHPLEDDDIAGDLSSERLSTVSAVCTNDRATPDTSQMTLDASQVTPDTSQMTLDASQVTPDTSQMTLDASQVTLDASQMTLDTSQMTPDASPVTPETSSAIPDTSQATESDRFDGVPLNFGDRAHITLGFSSGYTSVQTGLDQMELLLLDRGGRAVGEPIVTDGVAISHFGDGRCVVAFDWPIYKRSLFSGKY